jgi:hypothetical protein
MCWNKLYIFLYHSYFSHFIIKDLFEICRGNKCEDDRTWVPWDLYLVGTQMKSLSEQFLREDVKVMIMIVLIVMKVVCGNAEEEADDDDIDGDGGYDEDG